MALHLRLSWSQTGVTRGLTCHAANNLVDRVLSLPKDHHVRALRQVEWQPLLCEWHQTARVHYARRGYVLAEGLAYPLHDVLQRNNIMHHPQSGWCDEGPQRGPATRGKGLKALSTHAALSCMLPHSATVAVARGMERHTQTRLA
jgi:hypothetical protein